MAEEKKNKEEDRLGEKGIKVFCYDFSEIKYKTCFSQRWTIESHISNEDDLRRNISHIRETTLMTVEKYSEATQLKDIAVFTTCEYRQQDGYLEMKSILILDCNSAFERQKMRMQRNERAVLEIRQHMAQGEFNHNKFLELLDKHTLAGADRCSVFEEIDSDVKQLKSIEEKLNQK